MVRQTMLALTGATLSCGMARAAPPAHQAIIYSNIAASDPYGPYLSQDFSVEITGGSGRSWFAAAFTPVADAAVGEVAVAAGYYSGTHAMLTVHIYADANGVPGKELWAHKVGLTAAGTCCTLDTARVDRDIVLSGGTQYWLGLKTLPDGGDTIAQWYYNAADEIDGAATAYNAGAGWIPATTVPNVAFAVYAK